MYSVPSGEIADEAPHPIRVAALGAIRVVPGSDARSQLLERGQGIRAAVLVHDRADGPAVPVRAFEEVDEIDSEGVFGLTHLPLLTPIVALQALTEPAHLVGQRLVRGGTRSESAHPAHPV